MAEPSSVGCRDSGASFDTELGQLQASSDDELDRVQVDRVAVIRPQATELLKCRVRNRLRGSDVNGMHPVRANPSAIWEQVGNGVWGEGWGQENEEKTAIPKVGVLFKL